VGSLFAIADKLTQAAAAAQSTARTAFDAEAEEEAKVGMSSVLGVGGDGWVDGLMVTTRVFKLVV
jgi:hypothetical protein